jgi:group I intron endonuclease
VLTSKTQSETSAIDAYGVVYLVTHAATGRQYVGQTIRSIEARLRSHAQDKRTHVGRSIRKYGVDEFAIEAIERCHSQQDLDAAEVFWIDWYRTLEPLGFNVATGGRGVGPLSDEAKALVAAAKRGVKKSPEAIAKVAAAHRGLKRSEETRARMRAASAKRVRVPHSEDTKAKMSASQRRWRQFQNFRANAHDWLTRASA